jgi:hypothetical protein
MGDRGLGAGMVRETGVVISERITQLLRDSRGGSSTKPTFRPGSGLRTGSCGPKGHLPAGNAIDLKTGRKWRHFKTEKGGNETVYRYQPDRDCRFALVLSLDI